jgi:hypothetical protein
VSVEQIVHLLLASVTTEVIADASRNALAFGGLTVGTSHTLKDCLAAIIRDSVESREQHSRFCDTRIDVDAQTATVVERMGDGIATLEFADGKQTKPVARVRARNVVEIPNEVIFMIAQDFKHAK